MELREYQKEAIKWLYHYLATEDGNPVVCLPTASGKTPTAASICRDFYGFGERVLYLSHVRELIEQAKDKLLSIDPTLPVGVFCASLKSKQYSQPITVASIQSIFRRAHEFDPFGLIIVDEVHLVSDNASTMYRKFFDDCRIINPSVRLMGMTATPWRLTTGEICGPDKLFRDICYEVSVRELIDQGFICRPKTRSSITKINLEGVHVRGGELVPEEAAARFDTEELVKATVEEAVALTENRLSVLIFASSVAHGEHVTAKLLELGQSARFVCGETDSEYRAKAVVDFKARRFKFMVNVGVFHTGFDATNCDSVVLMRATNSPGWYVQAVGRGFRLHPGKESFDVVDFGGNVEKFGQIDVVEHHGKNKGQGGPAPWKQCPSCLNEIAAGFRICPECSHEFPPKEIEDKIRRKASAAPILSGEITDTEFEVRSVRYSLHRKKNAPEAPPTFRVDYSVGWEHFVPEWVCVEHEGFAGKKAEQWWKARTTLPFPSSVTEAVAIARAGGLTEPTQITVREISGQQFPRIINPVLGEPFVPGDSWETPTFEAAPKTERAAFNPAGWEWVRADEIQCKPASASSNYEEIPF